MDASDPGAQPMRIEQLDAADAELVARARAVRAHAYAPYSGFWVGAAVRTDRGVFAGANMENASYPLSCCAERNAIAAAISAGARHVEAVAVIADGERPITPCGGCRQVIHEFGPQARLVLASTEGAVHVCSLDELLPLAFGPRHLR